MVVNAGGGYIADSWDGEGWNLEENLGALEVRLGEETVREVRGTLERATVAGERYPAANMEWMFIDTPEL